ncbi:hypothetical protein FRX31_007746 [Thalictrum thalictroides]|uniref:Uncharacterized protein n=1 Tax=Thalictrum thalictroides TaxID=46969 RepID=A0A7J6X0U1_THATH|nr:hypothetical protein FRX31_007746 [Thalictrum thalictroides]
MIAEQSGEIYQYLESRRWDCWVTLDKHEFRANLIVYDMKNFDVYLGLRWMQGYHGRINTIS